MTLSEIQMVTSSYGWQPIESKNPYMLSFRHEEDAHLRMNVYTSKMTVTIQSSQYDGGIIANCKNVTMETLEDMCMSRM